MRFRLLACALTLVPGVPAQPGGADSKPQMIWQGEIEGTAFLYVHAKRLKVESKGGGPVENQHYRITAALPQSRQDVRLHVSEGRGYVHIAEQPRADNNYTLAIAIEDRQAGSSFYSLALDWDTGGVFDRANNRGRNQVKWSGRVEDEVLISCAADHCTSEAVRGVPVMREHFKFGHPLPQSDVEVALENPDGRGTIRLVEQPNEHNGYTARVQIRDPQSGASDYGFTLTWARAGRVSSEPLAARTGLVWSGRVEGIVRVTVHGGASFSEVVKGRPVQAENALFERSLPARSDLKPAIKKRQGRGTAEIVEYPNNQNGYQLVFEVRDSAGGSDLYEVEVAW